MGQSTCIGIGGDPINGTNFIDALAAFQADPGTDAIVLIGEIGGTDEDEAAKYIKKHVTKPVVTFIAGQTAPPGKRMGHAGAIISGGAGTAADKMKAFAAVGVPVAKIPSEIPALLARAMGRKAPKAGKAARSKAKPKPKAEPQRKPARKSAPAKAKKARPKSKKAAKRRR
jgi:succinyl-CoA synthetase alpha subunit